WKRTKPNPYSRLNQIRTLPTPTIAISCPMPTPIRWTATKPMFLIRSTKAGKKPVTWVPKRNGMPSNSTAATLTTYGQN
ncbi:MAG: hypothetical protein AVDCRST_MAG95-336, partial [uncultured Adhaeribacter sp.]